MNILKVTVVEEEEKEEEAPPYMPCVHLLRFTKIFRW